MVHGVLWSMVHGVLWSMVHGVLGNLHSTYGTDDGRPAARWKASGAAAIIMVDGLLLGKARERENYSMDYSMECRR